MLRDFLSEHIFFISTYIIYKKKKLATLVEGDPKAPFSITTTPRSWGESYSIPWIAPLYLYLIMLSVKQSTKVPFFQSLVWPDLGLNSGLPANALLIKPMAGIHYIIYREFSTVVEGDPSG